MPTQYLVEAADETLIADGRGASSRRWRRRLVVPARTIDEMPNALVATGCIDSRAQDRSIQRALHALQIELPQKEASCQTGITHPHIARDDLGLELFVLTDVD